MSTEKASISLQSARILFFPIESDINLFLKSVRVEAVLLIFPQTLGKILLSFTNQTILKIKWK